jgi:hypothetical protein
MFLQRHSPLAMQTTDSRTGSIEGRMEDALAPSDDEGRGKLRKATGRCKRPLIRRCPNGETLQVEDLESRAIGKATRGTETSKYPEE